MSLKGVAEYLEGGFKAVEGWCIPQLWQVIQPLREAVIAEGGMGPIAEIGVYHGKFFIGLVKTMDAPAANYAIDVFDLQQFNLDGAGKGNLEKFRENLKANGVEESRVQIFRTDSMWLNRGDIDRIRVNSGGFSMFSVDGCHMVEHTINDILFAQEVTLPQGIIFVDDYYNANWPGVQEGVAKLFQSHAPRFVPLVYTCNKLMLCNLSYHKEYLGILADFIRKHFPETKTKRVRRFGYDCINVLPSMHEAIYFPT